MFKLGSLVKIKNSSLARICDKPKIIFDFELVEKSKGLGLAWIGLIS